MAINFRASKANVRGSVISIDPLSKTIQFCTANEAGDDLSISIANYKDRAFDTEQLDRIGKTVKAQLEKNPETDITRSSLILPDRLFMLDMVNIPVIHRKAMQHSLSLAIESIYNNAGDLNLMTYGVQQTKQTATYGLVGIRRDLLENINNTFAQNGVTAAGITFASNAMVNGAMALNSKLRGETFMLLDIKGEYARYAIVVRGCTMGYYDLPFGYSMMYKSRITSEDMLFDHRAGELLVLNAKEKARAKELTMEGSFAPESANGEEGTPTYEIAQDGTLSKNGRKLPKFMQRPIPKTKEEFIYDNFRIFIKWALDLINNNRETVSLAKLDTVYINMPSEYRFLFDTVNKKHEGRGISFAPLMPEDSDSALSANLELYGGFFLNKYNEANTF